MYTPPAFRDDDRESIVATIRAARLANFITATEAGVPATPLPLYLDESEGEHGALYGHPCDTLQKLTLSCAVPPRRRLFSENSPSMRAPRLTFGLSLMSAPAESSAALRSGLAPVIAKLAPASPLSEAENPASRW
jgi:hypothetical protein